MRTVQPTLDMKLKGTRFAPSAFGGVNTPLCYLTTMGRKSGEPRTVPLVYVPAGGGAVAVVASNYGQDHHPAWSYNLDANPSASLEIDDRASPVLARRTTDAETSSLWPQFSAVWPGYDTYRKITDRDIKMYLLEPVGHTDNH
ncbi:MAG: nitroreductase/quinone reductase family protein [Acidimicrobiia bacterium]